MALQVGRVVPDFELPASTGEQVKLSDFRGKNVVLFFYPKDMTPTCTTEACDFRDRHANFGELDTVVLGISTNSVKDHKKFIAKYDLPYVLLADEDHKISERFGVWQEKTTFGHTYMGIVRSTFVIDKKGKLAKEWRSLKVAGHVEEAVNFIKENLV
jgi:thioredoxin-dependent peroxiredoxin